jgi:hypothetical protein
MRDEKGQRLEAWQWVEDSTLNWDKAGVQSIVVGELRVKPKSILSEKECDDPERGINVIQNASEDLKGVGRINRARTVIERFSKEQRKR